LDPAFLREVSQHQVGLLAERFDALDLPPEVIDRERDVSLAKTGGFLALRAPRAGDLQRALAARGVATDFRHDRLRLGPALYLSDAQLEAAIAALGEVARSAKEG
ncbi:MAG: kynureninase, partial [Thermoanaerobaculia bacterium]